MENEEKPGLWRRLRNAFAGDSGVENRVTKEPRHAYRDHVWIPPRTLAGVPITEENALTLSAFHAAIRYLSQTVGALPWHVMKEIPGGAEVAYSHPVDRILNDRASPEFSSQTFREVMVSWALRYGNSIAEIEPDQIGRPIALHPIHPSRVTFVRAEGIMSDEYGDRISPGEMYYQVDADTRLAARRIFHIRGMPGESGLGVSVVAYAAQTLGWAKAAQMFGAAFYGNGTHVGGSIENKLPMSRESLDEQRAAVEAAHKGPNRAFNLIYLDAEATYKPFSPKMSDSQFVEVHQHLVEEVARFTGVPPSKLMHLLHAHYDNVESENISVVTDLITPWCKRFEAEANYKLFGQNRRGHFARFNLRGLLRGNFADQNAGLEIMRRAGVISANEWREHVDMNPIPKEEGGDLRLVQAAQIPLARAGENFPQNDNTAPAKAA